MCWCRNMHFQILAHPVCRRCREESKPAWVDSSSEECLSCALLPSQSYAWTQLPGMWCFCSFPPGEYCAIHARWTIPTNTDQWNEFMCDWIHFYWYVCTCIVLYCCVLTLTCIDPYGLYLYWVYLLLYLLVIPTDPYGLYLLYMYIHTSTWQFKWIHTNT